MPCLDRFLRQNTPEEGRQRGQLSAGDTGQSANDAPLGVAHLELQRVFVGGHISGTRGRSVIRKERARLLQHLLRLRLIVRAGGGPLRGLERVEALCCGVEQRGALCAQTWTPQ